MFVSSSPKRSLVHQYCVDDLGWVADPTKVPSGHRHERLMVLMSLMSFAGLDGHP
jgi:hypothetical protein